MNPTLDDLLAEENWLEWRSRVPTPALSQTELVTTDQTRHEFIEGSRLLRLDTRPRGADGVPGPAPIQLVIADMLNANHKFNGVLEPRRTTKTTSIEAVILGRCSVREDYQAGWTLAKADGGQKTSERFKKDIIKHLVRLWPDVRNAPFIWSTSNGREHIRWPNGSYFNVYAPGNDAFTSGGFDFAWIDEGQDASPELSEDFLTSVPPTLDGRPGAQMVVSGTAPDYRDGNLLWKMLNHPSGGHVWHGAPDDTTPEELEAWEPSEEHPDARVRELIELAHPGLGFTTPLADVKDNFETMSSVAFAREYLSIPGNEGSNVRFIPAKLWEEAAQDTEPEGKPASFTLAISVHPDGLYASVGAAWLLPDGRSAIGLLHHQEGVRGFAKEVLKLARKHEVPVIYDSAKQAATVEVEQLKTASPPPKFYLATYPDVKQGATKVMKGLRERTVVHFRDEPLDAAAEVAVKRPMGMGGAWAFGRPIKNDDADITPLEACSLALQMLKEPKKKTKMEFVFSD